MTSKFYFSVDKNAFYPADFRNRYELSNSWPGDARPVSIDTYEEFMNPPKGKQRGVLKGEPCWVDIPPQLLVDAQAIAVSRINTFATDCRRKVAGNPDHLETAEWSEKRLRAIRVIDGSPLEGDIDKLEIEALHRDRSETAYQLATTIKSKADRFEHASIVITGMTSAAIKLVNEANTTDDIEELYLALKEKANLELQKLV
jgi:hypothetical protein